MRSGKWEVKKNYDLLLPTSYLLPLTSHFLMMQRVGGILKNFVKDYGLATGLNLSAIKKQWINLMGQTLAAHTSPDIIKGKTIFIIVDTPQWMHHLSFYKQEILEKLKHYKIENVRFKLGRVDADSATESGAADTRRLTGEDSEYIEDTIQNLKDAALKEKFRILLSDALRHERRK